VNVTGFKKQLKTQLRHSKEDIDKKGFARRVARNEQMLVQPILEKIIAIPDPKTPRVIAIDGRAAAGKTTIATILSAVLKADVIRMDDFFLPPGLRTPERYAQSGGNIHYERFCLEVLPFLKQAKEFSYRSFSCKTNSFTESRLIQSDLWRIVEGSYSNHPKFGNYADFKVFCDVSPEEQMQRIIKRNGESMAGTFQTKWIPLENKYFATGRIKEKADLVIE
jgi:uridine kinase